MTDREMLEAMRSMLEAEREHTSRMMDEKLDARLKPIQADIRQLNQTVSKIEVEHGRKLSALYDAHVDTVRNASTIDKLDAKVEDHGVRIWALEEAVRAK